MLSLLTSCVSIDSKLHLVTNALAASDETQACDVKPVLHPPIDGLTGLDPENIAFLNWNIYKGNGEDWQKDLTGFAENHDVMTIQEATLDDEFIHNCLL